MENRPTAGPIFKHDKKTARHYPLLTGLSLLGFAFLLLAHQLQANPDHIVLLPLLLFSQNYDILLNDATLTPHLLPASTGASVAWKNGSPPTHHSHARRIHLPPNSRPALYFNGRQPLPASTLHHRRQPEDALPPTPTGIFNTSRRYETPGH
ncbi:MAG: hypothetical protein Fur0021_10150 [Candidatus Promineifilaceae bacterium]